MDMLYRPGAFAGREQLVLRTTVAPETDAAVGFAVVLFFGLCSLKTDILL